MAEIFAEAVIEKFLEAELGLVDKAAVFLWIAHYQIDNDTDGTGGGGLDGGQRLIVDRRRIKFIKIVSSSRSRFC